MALRFLGLLLLFGSAPPARAQEAAQPPELSSLRLSSAPAFILLGVAPASVARPQTPADLAFQALSATRTLTTLPRELAIETAPYWFVSRPDLSWQDDTTRTPWESLQRTFSLSAGSAQLGTADAPATGLAAGLRMELLSGRVPEAVRDTLRAIERSAAAQGTLFQRFRQEELERLDERLRTQLALARDTTPAEDFPAVARDLVAEHQRRREALDARVRQDPAYLEQLEAEQARFQDFALVREGWFLSVAAGGAWSFPGDVWENGKFRRFGAWAALSHEGAGELGALRVTPVALVRYLAEAGDTQPDVLDTGARLILSAPVYAASVEWVGRAALGSEGRAFRQRLVGIFEYRLGADTWLQASFGKDQESVGGSDLVATLGLSLGLSQERYRLQ